MLLILIWQDSAVIQDTLWTTLSTLADFCSLSLSSQHKELSRGESRAELSVDNELTASLASGGLCIRLLR